MDDLVAFIRARIAEERADAEAAAPGPWTTRGCRIESADCDWESGKTCIEIYDEGGHTEADACHIARQDPAATIARCDALTTLIDLHGPHPDDPKRCGHCVGSDDYPFRERPCSTLHHVAMIWSAHPNYRTEWAAGT